MSCKQYFKVQTIMKQESLFNSNTIPSVENMEAILRYEFRDNTLTIDIFFENYANGKYTKYLSGRQERIRFYSSPEWKALKKEALSIYGSKCMVCGSTKDIRADHIISRQLDPSRSLDITNIGILCNDCNLDYSYYNKKDYRTDEELLKLYNYLKEQGKVS